jgi:hypothetical protein
VGEVIGLIPAAGRSARLQPIPCSKELFPIGFHENPRTGRLAPKVASHYLLEKFRAAGVRTTYIVIREGKWDIPQYFLAGDLVDMSLAYVVIPESIGPPDTIDRAYPFVRQSRIAFGFPDILFGPRDAYAQLIRKQDETGCRRRARPASHRRAEHLGHGCYGSGRPGQTDRHETCDDRARVRMALRRLDAGIHGVPASIPAI